MGAYKDLTGDIYECECAYQATCIYEENAVTGLISMKITGVLTTPEAVALLHKVEMKTNESFITILHELATIIDATRQAMNEDEIPLDVANNIVERSATIRVGIKEHVTKDREVVTDVEY